MTRIRDLISPESLRFADDYEVYVDYGKGRPIKMNENETNFIDVEKFLTGSSDSSKKITNEKYNGIVETYKSNRCKNNDTHEQTTRNKQYTSSKSKPHYSCRDSTTSSSSTTFQIGKKIIYDETWFSNKPYNTPVTASIDHIPEKFDSKIEQHQSTHKITCEASKRQIIHEKNYPRRIERKLYLNLAINGASKSMRGQVPSANLDLKTGDFGDDAGIFAENRDFSFVGLADGASGNRLLGINPADFSQAILAACQHIFHQNHLSSNQLSQLMTSALQKVQIDEVKGSSTICLLALDKHKQHLTTLNMGDSGFVIYRNNQLYYRSTCTMHSNGYGPKQLFALESSFGLPCFLDENDIVQDCSLDTIQVQHNDIIILSSDGLWDVIKANELQKIIQQNENKNLQNLANDLLNQAVNGYVVNNRDDILIIVCRVEEL